MKQLRILHRIILVIFIGFYGHTCMIAQNEFGTVGSYWKYLYEHHSGDGSGWTMIKIVKDTLIEDVEHKKYRWTHYYRSFMGEEYEQTRHGLLRIENDSVYLEDQFILDLDMESSDSLIVEIDADFLAIQLAIDSISVEQIDGVEYKKWHGQKLCRMEGVIDEPYEDFTFLETVGQIKNGYLFWNFDGCLIGGGSNRFECYKNGDFTYPPGQDCEESFLSNIPGDLPITPFNIYPNPVSLTLHLNFGEIEVHSLELINLNGRILSQAIVSEQFHELYVTALKSGLYLLRIFSTQGSFLARFVKD